MVGTKRTRFQEEAPFCIVSIPYISQANLQFLLMFEETQE